LSKKCGAPVWCLPRTLNRRGFAILTRPAHGGGAASLQPTERVRPRTWPRPNAILGSTSVDGCSLKGGSALESLVSGVIRLERGIAALTAEVESDRGHPPHPGGETKRDTNGGPPMRLSLTASRSGP
jgi:hypothetical protein